MVEDDQKIAMDLNQLDDQTTEKGRHFLADELRSCSVVFLLFLQGKVQQVGLRRTTILAETVVVL